MLRQAVLAFLASAWLLGLAWAQCNLPLDFSVVDEFGNARRQLHLRMDDNYT